MAQEITIGFLRTDYSTFMQLEEDQLFSLIKDNVEIGLSCLEPVAEWKSADIEEVQSKDIDGGLLRQMFVITGALFQWLKYSEILGEVVLQYKLRRDYLSCQVVCMAYELQGGEEQNVQLGRVRVTTNCES